MRKFIIINILLLIGALYGGHIEGFVQSNNTVYGQTYVGLFQPGSDHNYWVNRSAETALGDHSYPTGTDLAFNFDATWITDGDGWHVVAYIDINGNSQPDAGDPIGAFGPFYVSGGTFNTGTIWMSNSDATDYSYDFELGAPVKVFEEGSNANELDGATDFSIEFFVMFHYNTNNDQIIFEREADGGGTKDLSLQWLNNTQEFRLNLGTDGTHYGSLLAGGMDIYDNQWHHIYIQYLSGLNRLEFFWDGTLFANTWPSAPSAYMPTSDHPLIFGVDVFASMDEFRIRTTSEDYGANAPVPGDPWIPSDLDPNTLLLWHCNENGGNVLIDDGYYNTNNGNIDGNGSWDMSNPWDNTSMGHVWWDPPNPQPGDFINIYYNLESYDALPPQTNPVYIQWDMNQSGSWSGIYSMNDSNGDNIWEYTIQSQQEDSDVRIRFWEGPNESFGYDDNYGMFYNILLGGDNFTAEPLYPICGSGDSQTCNPANASIMEAMVDGNPGSSSGIGGNPDFYLEFGLENGHKSINEIKLENGFPETDSNDDACFWAGEGYLEVWDDGSQNWDWVVDINNPTPEKVIKYSFQEVFTDKIRLTITQVGGNQNNGCHPEFTEISVGKNNDIGGGDFSFDFGTTSNGADVNNFYYPAGNQITVEMFIKLHTNDTTFDLFDVAGANDWLLFAYEGSEFIFELEGIGSATWSTSFPANEWHHLAADYDGTQMRIYFDGLQMASVPASNPIQGPVDPLTVGWNLDGLGDVIRISTFAQYSGNSFDPWNNNYSPDQNTQLLWDCNEGGGETLTDISAHGLDGSGFGTGTWNTDTPLGGVGTTVTLWSTSQSSSGINLMWDRWPDDDGDFNKYEIRWKNSPGINEGDMSILTESNPNIVSWLHDTPNMGDNYYKLYMYDHSGVPRYETNEQHVFLQSGNGRVDFTIESPTNSSGNIYAGIFYSGNIETGEPDVGVGPIWHDFNTGSKTDFIDGIVEGNNYAIAFFFDEDGSQNSGPEFCDAGQDLGASLTNINVWGTSNIGSIMLGNCDGGPPAEGEFSIEYSQFYWVAEEENIDTTNISVTNIGDGELNVTQVSSTKPSQIYVIEDEHFPVTLLSGETKEFLIVLDYTSGAGVHTGTITFSLDNAITTSASIDYQIEVFESGEIEISTEEIEDVSDGTYDLTETAALSFDFSDVSTEGSVEVTYVDGTSPPTPSGSSGIVVGPRYWDIQSSLDDDTFIADICFDISDLGEIDSFSELIIIKRALNSNDAWITTTENDLSFNEEDGIICADNQTSFSQWAIGSDSSGTNFLPDPPTLIPEFDFSGSNIPEGEDFVLNVSIEAEAGIQEVTYNWVSGKELFSGNTSSGSMVFSNNTTYTSSINGDNITLTGGLLWITATDSLDRTTTSDTFDVAVSFSTIPFLNTEAEKYQMTSIPNVLSSNSIPSVFEDELGEYDKSVWRLFNWNGSDYGENNFSIEPGNAFWVITKDPTSLSAGSGTSLSLKDGHTVSLNEGWNMIGNPYGIDFSFPNQVTINGNVELILWGYNGNGYIQSTTLYNTKGYWLYSNEAGASIDFSPTDQSGFNAKTVAENWSFNLSAKSGSFVDAQNRAGVHAVSLDGYDVNDFREPPVIGSFVQLAFPHNEWVKSGLFSTDYREDGKLKYIWTPTVKTNIQGRVEIQCSDFQSIPVEYEIYLIDLQNRSHQNMRETNIYTFISSGNETERELIILVGESNEIEKSLEELDVLPSKYMVEQNYPNPFNPTTSIRLHLHEPATVSINIFNILGNEVNTLLKSVDLGSGYHTVTWDGTNRQASPLSSGVYFYQTIMKNNKGELLYQSFNKMIYMK